MSRVDHAFDALASFWHAPAPPERLATLRLLSGAFAWIYLCAQLPHFADYSPVKTHFYPVGVVTIVDRPVAAWLTWLLAVATLAVGLAFVSGWRFRVTGPTFAALLLWVLSYRSSWSLVATGEALLIMHIIALALSPAADVYALDARRREKPAEQHARYGWPVKLLCALALASLLVAGISKLRLSGTDWLTTDLLHNRIAHDALRAAELGADDHALLGSWAAEHQRIFGPAALLILAIELGAPLALLGRRAATIWSAAVILYRLALWLVAATFLPYTMLGIGLACFFRIERPAARVARLLSRGRTVAQRPA